MPGFSIVYDLTGERSKQELAVLNGAMTATMMHFDWYIQKSTSSERAAFSIVSPGLLNAEQQPIRDEDGSLLVMLYGELYDSDEIRKELVELGHEFRTDSDAEIVLHLYEDRGENCVKELNGSFNILIYDKPKRKFIVCNDRYGTRPLYWTKYKGLLLIASEIKATVVDKSLERKVNFAGLVDFVAAGYLLHNKTLLEGIEVLPAATTLVVEGENLRFRKYWSWYDISRLSLSYDDAVERMGQLWMQAVRRCTRDALRYGVTLSGGLDSRAVHSAVVALGDPVDAWTFGLPECLDIQIANRVCEVLGVEHHVWLTSGARWRESIEQGVWLHDGLLDVVNMHALGMLASMREHVGVRLHGFVGDLIAGGSYLLRRDVRFSSLDQLEGYLIEKYYKISPARVEPLSMMFAGSYGRGAARAFAENVSESVRDFIVDPNATDFYFINNRVRRFANHGGISTLALMVDRKPFLDNDFVEFIYGLPSKWRVDSRIYSDMLLRFFPKSFKTIPWQKTGVPISLPKRIQDSYRLLAKGKRIVNAGFKRVGLPIIFNHHEAYADYNNWMRDDILLRNYIIDALLSDRGLGRGYFKPVFVQRIVNEHMQSKRNHAPVIGILLTFEIFCRQFLDG